MRFLFWILLISLIFIRFFSTRPIYKDAQKIRITARITSEPQIFENTQRLEVAGLKAYVPRYPELSYGDSIILEGRVEGRELKQAELVSLRENQRPLPSLRRGLIEFYQKSLPEPHSALISGIVLGSKYSISTEFWGALKRTGTTHVVVASGMNVTLVAKFLISVFVLFISRKKAIWLALGGIWVYSLISGFEAPIIRAAIMGSIAFVGQGVGRLSQAWRAFLMSGFGMLILKPVWLSDIGFILSFAATAGLMLFEERIRKRLMFLPSFLREGFSTSLAAQIIVAPILLISFGQLNFLSVLVNALVLWTVPIIMILGGIGGILGLTFEHLGRLILVLSYPLTLWFVWIVKIFGNIP